MKGDRMILDKIKSDLKQAMIDRDEKRKSTLRMVIGEVPRLNKKANEKATDDEILNIIKKLIKSETIVLEASGIPIGESEYINILDSYLPKMMSQEEIIEWIGNNINLDEFNPKIKAMGSIMKELKGKADGNTVRKILELK
jgi:uncharacterized protein YqeY